jgi:hypothetical protein
MSSGKGKKCSNASVQISAAFASEVGVCSPRDVFEITQQRLEFVGRMIVEPVEIFASLDRI